MNDVGPTDSPRASESADLADGADQLDWPGGALTSLRAGAAEAVVADLAWYEDQEASPPGDTRWRGGHTRGVDVVGVLRRDAKHVTCKNGVVILCRFGGTPYDAEKVDRITLVELASATTGWFVAPDGQRGRGEIAFEVANVWDIPTADLNSMLPEPGNYRNVELPATDLAPFLVRSFPPP